MRFYHVTKRVYIENIRRSGLRAQDAPWWNGRLVFLWSTWAEARRYAAGRFWMARNQAVILTVNVPAEWVRLWRAIDRIYVAERDIPASRVHIASRQLQ